MDLAKEKQQQKEFCDILFDLAVDQQMLEDSSKRSKMYQRLERLYYPWDKETGFRHYYSDIFRVVTEIGNSEQPEGVDILCQNLSLIRDGYQAVNQDKNGTIVDISDNIKKLYDHVNLDVSRIKFLKDEGRRILGEDVLNDLQSENNRIKSEIDSSREEQEDLRTEIIDSKTEQIKIKEELKNQQKEYIAILGIFAAVVLAFTGGIAFTTSVLNNIHRVSVYRIAIISLIIGLVLINILFGLFYYVDKLVNGESGKRLAPLIVSNVVIIALLAVISVAWWYGCVEKRNDRIDKQNITITQQINPDTQNIPPGSDHAGPSFAVISVKSRQRQVFLS